MKVSIRIVLVGAIIILVVSITAYLLATNNDRQAIKAQDKTTVVSKRLNPLENKKFYVDQERSVVKNLESYTASVDTENAKLLNKIAVQPGTTWLVGPNESDLLADHDIAEVARTTTKALETDTVPVYQLYAIPKRDACAEFSKGGFVNSAEYLIWLDRILNEIKTPSVFSVEADAVVHTVMEGCMNKDQASERYKLLDSVMARLSQSPNVLAAYLDAGHSEWFADPSVLKEPLINSGVKKGNGVVVNVSNFVSTEDITQWSQDLIQILDADLGIIIDTSRNGKGTPEKSVTGDARWCNPVGRGLGMPPTGNTETENIDAHLWIKIPVESDGACFGNPDAGVFSPKLAIELAKNSIQ